jgi:hypothetical protein
MHYVPEFLQQINYGQKAIFRGHADKEWLLIPSIGRHFSGDWAEVVEREKRCLQEFKKRSIPYLKSTPTSDMEWLCLMQHHGCATRLLDFTINPLIALFFATELSVETDGEVIIIEPSRSYDNVSDDDLFTRKEPFAYHPPHITERIIGQSGCFVYSPRPNKPLISKKLNRITIKHHEKYRFRNELSALGVDHSSLFPGIDGVCRVLNDVLITNLEFDDLF